MSAEQITYLNLVLYCINLIEDCTFSILLAMLKTQNYSRRLSKQTDIEIFRNIRFKGSQFKLEHSVNINNAVNIVYTCVYIVEHILRRNPFKSQLHLVAI